MVGSLRHGLCIQARNDTSNWQSRDPKVSFTKILSRKCTHWSPVWKTKITTVWQRARHTYHLSTRWRWRSPLSTAPLGGLLVSRPLGSSGDHFLWLYDLLTIFAEKKAPNTNFKGTVWNFALKKSMQKINNDNLLSHHSGILGGKFQLALFDDGCRYYETILT